MIVTSQQLRNLTTGRLHTEMGDIYSLIDFITQSPGIMTHQIPRAVKAIEPWLREQVPAVRFWNGEYDPSHEGEYDLAHMTADENAAFFERYSAMPDPLDGKKIMVVESDQ